MEASLGGFRGCRSGIGDGQDGAGGGGMGRRGIERRLLARRPDLLLALDAHGDGGGGATGLVCEEPLEVERPRPGEEGSLTKHVGGQLGWFGCGMEQRRLKR